MSVLFCPSFSTCATTCGGAYVLPLASFSTGFSQTCPTSTSTLLCCVTCASTSCFDVNQLPSLCTPGTFAVAGLSSGRSCATLTSPALEQVRADLNTDPANAGCCSIGAVSAGDPYVEGYLGQHFFIDGPDAWYNAITTDSAQVNLKMFKFPGQNGEQGESYWIGASIQTFAEDGSLSQSVLMEAVNGAPACSAAAGAAPCIGNGGVLVSFNGQALTQPERITAGSAVLDVANLHASCKHVTKTFLSQHPAEEGKRGLNTASLLEHVIGREMYDPQACMGWMGENTDIYQSEGEQATLLFSAPQLTTMLEFYRYEFEGQQYQRIDISFLQLQVKDVQHVLGVVGETMRPRFDEAGKMLMEGQVLEYPTEDYMAMQAGVNTPWGRKFAAKTAHQAKPTLF